MLLSALGSTGSPHVSNLSGLGNFSLILAAICFGVRFTQLRGPCCFLLRHQTPSVSGVWTKVPKYPDGADPWHCCVVNQIKREKLLLSPFHPWSNVSRILSNIFLFSQANRRTDIPRTSQVKGSWGVIILFYCWGHCLVSCSHNVTRISSAGKEPHQERSLRSSQSLKITITLQGNIIHIILSQKRVNWLIGNKESQTHGNLISPFLDFHFRNQHSAFWKLEKGCIATQHPLLWRGTHLLCCD